MKKYLLSGALVLVISASFAFKGGDVHLKERYRRFDMREQQHTDVPAEFTRCLCKKMP